MSEGKPIREILQIFGFSEQISEVQTFKGYRNGKKTTVEILDLGPECENPLVRFACQANQEDAKKAMGNSAATGAGVSPRKQASGFPGIGTLAYFALFRG